MPWGTPPRTQDHWNPTRASSGRANSSHGVTPLASSAPSVKNLTQLVQYPTKKETHRWIVAEIIAGLRNDENRILGKGETAPISAVGRPDEDDT